LDLILYLLLERELFINQLFLIMDYTGPYRYTLLIQGNEGERIIGSKLDSKGNIVSFSSPVTLKKRPKIYILKDKENIIYIGYTSQSIANRLRYGINPKWAKGYHGYKWKVHEKLELLLFVFDNKLIEDQNEKDKTFIRFVESVEAELVYLVRSKTGKWPENQNEIHFNNFEIKKAKQVAEKIYKAIEN
jgi:hypothetical protein